MKRLLFLTTFMLSSLSNFAQTDTIVTKNNKVTIGTINYVNDTAVFYTDKTGQPKYFRLNNITFYVKSGETIIPSTIPSITTTIIQPIKDSTNKTKLIIGVHAAPDGATWWGNHSFRKDYDIQYRANLGFILGVSVKYDFKKYLTLNTEINYEKKGVMMLINSVSDPNGYSIGTVRELHRMDYLALPVFAKFKNTKKTTGFYANVGMYLSYILKYDVYRFPIGVYPGSKSNNLNDVYPFDYGLITSLGQDIQIKDHFQFSIEVRNNLGLHRIVTGETLFKVRNESFALLFGLAYKIKVK